MLIQNRHGIVLFLYFKGSHDEVSKLWCSSVIKIGFFIFEMRRPCISSGTSICLKVSKMKGVKLHIQQQMSFAGLILTYSFVFQNRRLLTV